MSSCVNATKRGSMSPLVQFRPGVFAREGERCELDGKLYVFFSRRWREPLVGSMGREAPGYLSSRSCVDTSRFDRLPGQLL